VSGSGDQDGLAAGCAQAVGACGQIPRFGLRLRRGDVVTTGVATDVFEAGAGDSCVADFGPLGTVTVSFD
jgi:2-keto-4-pentenoate hydratase